MNQQSQQEPALEESRAKRSEQLEAGAHCPAREKLVESVEEEAAGDAHLLRPLLILVFLLYHNDDLNQHLLVILHFANNLPSSLPPSLPTHCVHRVNPAEDEVKPILILMT